ncbi:pantoate--beta-alanine ligase [Acidiferrimicrobium sp. IK]|uniref:pantoate--beta-alanine ligase n=1 Tax=Acidiferrimicrobium sp. IK TaxID=2871700 RepID=UPI0021CAF933|nr:pantoate--beta-alanine ligase [Acidiferrimicrobium sp. IK]MCU4186979.1 pantoate--beta-alanine ligase [Acidiferrimicrobium sp. IK]
MELITDPVAWRDAMDAARRDGHQVGLVPTMGALHAGHLSLIRRARADCGVVAVTNYVNPLQFGAGEDLAAYPRDLEGDARAAESVGADVMFAPSVREMWPEEPRTTIHVGGISEVLDGASRPGHFDGVATIVAKLLALAGRCWAYFGEKDFQQLAVIRRLVDDLSLPVFVIGCPIVRTTEGLALSSRNAYLTPDELAVAPALYWSLLAGKRAVEDDGETDPAAVVDRIEEALGREPRFELDYAAVVDPATFDVPGRIETPVRLLVAARLGRARLIDNLPASLPGSAE